MDQKQFELSYYVNRLILGPLDCVYEVLKNSYHRKEAVPKSVISKPIYDEITDDLFRWNYCQGNASSTVPTHDKNTLVVYRSKAGILFSTNYSSTLIASSSAALAAPPEETDVEEPRGPKCPGCSSVGTYYESIFHGHDCTNSICKYYYSRTARVRRS